MIDGRTVLGLIEQREGIRIDERRLSARLCGRIEKVDEMLIVFDKLKVEVDASKRGRQVPLGFLSITGVFGVVGAVLGLTGLIEGFLPIADSGISLVAAVGIFVVDFLFWKNEMRVRAAYRARSQQVEEVSVELDNALDRIYDEIVAELSTERNLNMDWPGPRARLDSRTSGSR